MITQKALKSNYLKHDLHNLIFNKKFDILLYEEFVVV